MGIGKLSVITLFLASGCATAGIAPPACQVSVADSQWLQNAMTAWDHARNVYVRPGKVEKLNAIFFDASCQLSSDTAMIGKKRSWQATSITKTVRLPDNNILPISGPVSFAASGDKPFFVMALPGLWKEANVDGSAIGLNRLTTAVLLHEATHVMQMPSYGRRIDPLIAKGGWGEDFDDDWIQRQFGENSAFAESIAVETKLLLAVADEPDREKARKIAKEALRLMDMRRTRWFVGKYSGLVALEDIFLTLEGAGNWVGYRWLIDAKGAGVAESTARTSFGLRGRWWSQKQGFALIKALDRLDSEDSWKAEVFDRGQKTATDMLRAQIVSTMKS